MVEYILICSIFGVATSLIAHSKARNALGWFVGGFLVGPFALVVAVLPPALRAGHTKRCPQCYEIIQERAQLCRHCHSPVQSEYLNG